MNKSNKKKEEKKMVYTVFCNKCHSVLDRMSEEDYQNWKIGEHEPEDMCSCGTQSIIVCHD